MMALNSDDRGGIIMEGPSDPDAQATVTDFIDYTEYLPADLVRSLTLIRGLDETYLNATAAVHELTKTYGALPSFPPESRPEPVVLRKQISEQLSRAINAREAAYAEACRLYDAVDRHFDRLGYIKSKLEGMLDSFTDDSLAAAQATPAADGKRDRSKAGERQSVPRITLRFDASRHRGEGPDGAQQKSRNRGATRADHLRYDADTAIASTERPGAEEEPRAARVAAGAPTTTAPKKKDATKKSQASRRVSRGAGSGTPGDAASGLEKSTKQTLADLEPPPEDAEIGSEHLPWLRLSDWEMAKLRKRMKKNNTWQPSDIMINRELAQRGRGWENYRIAKANAERTGTKLVDCDDIMNNYIPDTLLRKSEVGDGRIEVDKTKLSNRGMKLNEAKKLKRENLAREQAALAAAEAEMAAKRLGESGSTPKSLFPNPAEQSPLNHLPHGRFGASSSSVNTNGIPSEDTRTKANKPSSKKRKHEETSSQDSQQQAVESPIAVSSAAKPGTKRTKPGKPEDQTADEVAAPPPTTIKLHLTTGGASTSKKSSPVQSPVETKKSSRRLSIASRTQHTPTPPVTRTHSRRPSISGVSVEPSGRELRKKSATPAATAASKTDQVPAITRRSKRPAPGPVTAGQDGGAAVSVGRRKAKPAHRKKKDQAHRGSSQPLKEDIRIDEDGVLEEIDPNEPRYCLCGDVSFGTMICCEDNDCDKEWFHLECVGLSDVPSRTAKWYCPDCRKKNNIAASDGIVRTTGRR